MNVRTVLLAATLALAGTHAFAAENTDIFGRQIVKIDEVQQLYDEEPYSDPLPQLWAREHQAQRRADTTSGSSRESGVSIEKYDEAQKARLEQQGFEQYAD